MTSPFLFIVGSARSGTTLLRAMFDSHPEMAVPPESQFIPLLARMRGRYEHGPAFASELFVDDLLKHRRFRRWALPREELKAALSGSPPRDYPDAIRTVFRLYATRQGKIRFGDKTPRYVLHIPLLSELLPEARFIHIIRDGRDVTLSALDMGHRTIEEAALSWKRCVERGHAAGRRLGRERYVEVRYEDLPEDPERVLRPLCRFVGLRFEDAMLRYFDRTEEVLTGVGRSERHQRLYLPPTKGLRDWRSQMSKADAAAFEAVAGHLLGRLGYERVSRRPSVGVRVDAGRRLIALSARRAARRVRELPLHR